MSALQEIHVATEWGPFRIVWSEKGLVRTGLPDGSSGTGYASGETPAGIEPINGLGERIRAYFRGEGVNFDDLPLDETGIGEKERAIYRELRQVPRGQTLTYGMLAMRAGLSGEARTVGAAMGRNPWPLIVPCHRVLAADGRPGGFSAPGGVSTKLRMLRLEGARLPEEAPLLPGLLG